MENLPRQGSNVEKTRVRINSWAASHEEKMAACAKKIKRENTRKSEDSKNGLHRQMIMNGGQGKKLKIVVLLRILNLIVKCR